MNPSPKLGVLVLVFLLAFFSSFVSGAEKNKQRIISRIAIRGTDVFDLEIKTYLNKFPYSWINALHIKTKERIIHEALLFRVGDPLDPFLLRETERILRAFSFIRAARVVSFPQRDGSVSLVVHVNDAWTTEPQINLGGVNSLDKFEIGIKEKNFLGLGKTLQYFYTKEDDVIQNEFAYFDPLLLGSRWQLSARVIEASNGRERGAKIERPYYAADVRWTAGTSYDKEVRVLDQYVNNEKVSQYEKTQEASEVFAGLKLNKSRRTIHRTRLRYHNEAISYSQTPETNPSEEYPQAEDQQIIYLDWETLGTKYIETTKLEKMTRVEDINLGGQLNLSPGYSPRDLTGKDPTTQFAGSINKITRLGPKDILSLQFSHSSQDTLDQPYNQMFNFSGKYYFRKWTSQTLVLNTRAEWGESLVEENPITLGGDNGLRSFETDAFRGSKSLLFNLEDRAYFIDDLWDFFSVGGVLFYDSGYAWEKQSPIALNDFKSDIGCGLRFGLTKSSNEVIVRMDVSYRLQTVHSDDPKWVFTFGSGQAF